MTTPAEGFKARLQELGLGEEWEWNNGAWWAKLENADVRASATQMLALGARFVAITAVEIADKEIRLDYQWDLEGQLLSFTSATITQHIPTIADLSPAADWVERETHEYFLVEFAGRDHTRPLMTRAGDPLGINLHKEVAL
ncbi:MAG TPA: NADH-quinone oxidoreductase subunit C [Acidobacteriaceae bacterium]